MALNISVVKHSIGHLYNTPYSREYQVIKIFFIRIDMEAIKIFHTETEPA